MTRKSVQKSFGNVLGNIIQGAIDLGASDIHLDTADRRRRLRYRVNGRLQEGKIKLTAQSAGSAVAALKRLSGIAAKSTGKPQTGRLTWEQGERDFFVSVTPCLGGESVALRHFTRASLFKRLDDLGIEKSVSETLLKWTARRNGVVLVNGRAGSGKATMLYALLHELNKPDVKVVTIEDPVAYSIEGVTHIGINMEKGLDYDAALKCFLQTDADILMLGEVKNAETAEAAFKAAASGHRVISLTGQEDCADTLAFLREVGIAPEVLCKHLVGISSQRLVKKICKHCKTAKRSASGARYYVGKGCKECKGTGFRGRAAVFELLEINDKIKSLIRRGATADELRRGAQKAGVRLLEQSAIAAAKAGVTTMAEAVERP